MKVVLLVLSFNLFISYTYCQLWKQYADSAKNFLDKKDNESAIEYYRKANDILAKDSFFTDNHIRYCRIIADFYFSRNMYSEAEPYYLEVRKVIEQLRGKYNGEYASNADTLGQVYFSINPPHAEIFFIEAKNIREKVFTKSSKEYAVSCNNLGNLYNSLGENEKARSFYLEAIEIRQKLLGKEDPAYAQSCNNLASVYWKMGEYENAEYMALEAKRIREKLPPLKQSRSYAITCTNLANIYRDIGQYEKAEALYKEALQIRSNFLPLKQNSDYASSCNILADLYYYMGRYEKAALLYLEAKDIRGKQLPGTSVYAESCNNLASLYKEMGHYDKAESLLMEAKKIYDGLPEAHPSHAINLNNLGELYFATGDFLKAKSYFFQVREIWEQNLGKDHPYYYQNAANLARVYWNLDESSKADSFYRESFKSEYSQVNKIFRFTNEMEKELYLKNVNASGDEYQSFYYQKADPAKADHPYTISLLNRNLVLSSTQQVRRLIQNSGDADLYRKYNSWISLKQELAKLYSGSNDVHREEINKLENDANDVEKELTRQSSSFKNSQKKLSWQQIQNNLEEGEAAIEFIQFQNFNGKRWTDSISYVALLLRKDKPYPISIPLFESKQLDELMAHANRSERITALYTRGITDTIETNSSASIYDLVWKSLEKELKGIKKIYYSPAGDLFKVSFAALPVSDKLVLSDKYRLVQLNTTASVTGELKKLTTHNDKIQLYGGIEYDTDSTILKQNVFKYRSNSRAFRSLPGDISRGNGFQYLPGTLKEVVAIKKIAQKVKAPVTLLSGNHATEESFDLLNGKRSPGILHIATHGFFFPDNDTNVTHKNFEINGKVFKQSHNPLMRSGLLFAGANFAWKGNSVYGVQDGILTAYEISNMDLPNTNLVVLSACKTALGDIQGSEGVYGLQRAFKMAGVQNLVMSLWEVPDAETAEFMQIFYHNIFNKQSVSDSFYNAQSIMKKKYRKDPYKWAAWILVR